MGQYTNPVTQRVRQSQTEIVLHGDFNSDGRKDRLIIQQKVNKQRKAGSYIVSNYTKATIFDGLTYLRTEIISGDTDRSTRAIGGIFHGFDK